MKWHIASLTAVFLSIPAFAKTSEYGCATSGYVQTCNLYLDPQKFSVTANVAVDPQQQANWCWLASIEMAFRYYGYIVPQQKILELLWGRIEDMPGRPEQIIAATNRVYAEEGGRRFRAESIQEQSWFDASYAISRNVPVLCGYAQAGGVGHMTMIIGMQCQFLYDVFGQVVDSRVVEVVVWDPWPGVGVRDLTPTEFNSVFSLIAVGAVALDPIAVRTMGPRTIETPLSLRFDILGRKVGITEKP
jgi:hypothetical protein